MVVGGGPAGAICAFLLARAGARVALIRRCRNRFSAVELLSARARRILETYLDQRLDGCEISETLSSWDTQQPVSWSAMCNPWGYGLAVDRATFDEVLVRAAQGAGVWVLPAGEARSAERRRDAWTLTVGSSPWKAGHLVLATGAGRQSLIDRATVAKPAQFAFMAHVDVDLPEQRHTFHLEAGKDGWWYGMPSPRGGRFVGFCTRTGAIKSSRGTFLRRIANLRLLEANPAPGVRALRVSGRPAGPGSYEQVVGKRWIAVGDAAFVSDPLSGMGIEFAIESARLAAEALCAKSRGPALARYGEAVQGYARQHERVSAIHHQRGIGGGTKLVCVSTSAPR